MASATTISVDFFISLLALAALPPKGNAGNENDSGDKDDVNPLEQRDLSFGERDAAAGGGLRTNGHHVFVLREPVDGIVEKIAVALLGDQRVLRVLRVPDHDESGGV